MSSSQQLAPIKVMESPCSKHVRKPAPTTLIGLLEPAPSSPQVLISFSTGETPWIRDMITKYHEVAQRTGAIVSKSILMFWHMCRWGSLFS